MDEVLAMDKQVKLENVVVVKQEAERLAADRFIAPDPRLTQLLGEFLVKEGLANQQEIDAAMAMQRLNGGRLGEILQAQLGIRALDYYKALARYYGRDFVDLVADKPDSRLLLDSERDIYVRELVLPVRQKSGAIQVATADPSDRVFQLIRTRWGDNAHIVVTSKFDIFWTIQNAFNKNYTHEIINELYEKTPEKSAFKTFTMAQKVIAITVLAGFFALLYIHHPAASILANTILTLSVTATLAYKLLFAVIGLSIPIRPPINDIDEMDEPSLPVYTILVPLFHEKRVTIESLANNLQKLDYPPHKLDIKLVLESDDLETINIAKALHLPSRFEIVLIPPSEPRTKPKACNYALKFARGEYVTIFDAEDHPDPRQIKLALRAFSEGDAKLACVQCALNYYNSRENWLTRMFTMEYTFWFDLMLPAMSKLSQPIPLGGTSNHFRTEFLRNMVAWDPFNVTEDADLGIRINRLGYESKVLSSTTYEEATSRVIPWIKQRTRWMKGYMQTYLVHMRQPARLYRELGLKGFLGFQLFVGGAIFANLTNLILLVVFGLTLWFGASFTSYLFPSPILEVAWFNFVVGNLLLMLLNLLAIWRRRMFDLIPFVLTVPVYWLLASIATYRALYQIFFKPSYWDKTEHGVSKVHRTDLHD